MLLGRLRIDLGRRGLNLLLLLGIAVAGAVAAMLLVMLVIG